VVIACLAVLGLGCSSRAGEPATAKASAPTESKSSSAPTGSKADSAPSPSKTTSVQALPLEDKPLKPFQKELLDLGFKTATAIPKVPHQYDRSRTQLDVVTVCLELDQPERALACIEKIEDWRKGQGLAELALYCVKHGHGQEVQPYLDRAVKIAELEEDWMRDRVRVAVAKVHAALGEAEKARQLEAGVESSEMGKVAGVQAKGADEASFQSRCEVLDRLISTRDFDITRNALESYTQLFNQFYANTERRSLVEKKIRGAWAKMPVFLQMDLEMTMAGFARDHGDKARALEGVNAAQTLMDGAQWPLEHQLPYMARLAALRFQAGDMEKATADAKAARALFEAEGDTKIVDIYRAAALRPLGEACQAMGDTAAAQAVYTRIIEEGVINPNSRPRAEDLAATCCSMALHAVEPEAQLWTRMRTISQELGPPW
jgi:hypothetical protein